MSAFVCACICVCVFQCVLLLHRVFANGVLCHLCGVNRCEFDAEWDVVRNTRLWFRFHGRVVLQTFAEGCVNSGGGVCVCVCVCVCEREIKCVLKLTKFSLPSQLPSCVDTTGPCWIIVFFVVLAQNWIIGSLLNHRVLGFKWQMDQATIMLLWPKRFNVLTE